jgi:hypothetical protein
MDQDALVTQQVEAAAEFVRRLGERLPVAAAFWLKPTQEGRWQLYIASERVRGETFRAAHGAVAQAAREMRNPDLDTLRIRLISDDHPLAREALLWLQLYPGDIPIRRDGPVFGDTAVEGVYIYPATLTRTIA